MLKEVILARKTCSKQKSIVPLQCNVDVGSSASENLSFGMSEHQHKFEPQAIPTVACGFLHLYLNNARRPYTFVGLIGMATLNIFELLAVQRDLMIQRMDIPSWQLRKRVNQQNRHWDAKSRVKIPDKRMSKTMSHLKDDVKPRYAADAVVAVRLSTGCSNDGTNKTNCEPRGI